MKKICVKYEGIMKVTSGLSPYPPVHDGLRFREFKKYEEEITEICRKHEEICGKYEKNMQEI